MRKIIPLIWRPLVWLSFLAVTMVGCAPAPDFPKKENRDEIHFGQGGGFSGAVIHYILLEDGRVFQQAWRDTSLTYIDTWPGIFTRQMFLNYKSLKLDTLKINEPGDLYYFIEYHSKKKPTQRIVWGNPDFQAPQNLAVYYSTLYKSIKPNS